MRKLKERGRKYPEDVRQFDYMESNNGIKGLVMSICKTSSGEITRFKVIDPDTRQIDYVYVEGACEWNNFYDYGQEGKEIY